MAQSNKPFKMSGVTLFWASLASPNPMSDKYQVDLCSLTEHQVKGLEAKGLEVHNKGDERGYYLTAKSKFPITTTDTKGELIRGNTVGNGSVGDVILVTYPFTVGKGTGLGVNKLVVTEQIEYGNDIADFDDVEEL